MENLQTLVLQTTKPMSMIETEFLKKNIKKIAANIKGVNIIKIVIIIKIFNKNNDNKNKNVNYYGK